MKNKAQVKAEMKLRTQAAIKRGAFETPAQIKQRLLNSLQKSWFGYNGKLWTLRAYLLAYDRKEYKSILNALSTYYKGLTLSNVTGNNLNFPYFDYLQQDKTVDFAGRTPISGYTKKS